jgi:hypothetical protein
MALIALAAADHRVRYAQQHPPRLGTSQVEWPTLQYVVRHALRTILAGGVSQAVRKSAEQVLQTAARRARAEELAPIHALHNAKSAAGSVWSKSTNAARQAALRHAVEATGPGTRSLEGPEESGWITLAAEDRAFVAALTALPEPRRTLLRIALEIGDLPPDALVARAAARADVLSVACDLVAERGWSDATLAEIGALLRRN